MTNTRPNLCTNIYQLLWRRCWKIQNLRLSDDQFTHSQVLAKQNNICHPFFSECADLWEIKTNRIQEEHLYKSSLTLRKNAKQFKKNHQIPRNAINCSPLNYNHPKGLRAEIIFSLLIFLICCSKFVRQTSPPPTWRCKHLGDNFCATTFTKSQVFLQPVENSTFISKSLWRIFQPPTKAET